jgi:hypothetical protein
MHNPPKRHKGDSTKSKSPAGNGTTKNNEPDSDFFDSFLNMSNDINDDDLDSFLMPPTTPPDFATSSTSSSSPATNVLVSSTADNEIPRLYDLEWEDPNICYQNINGVFSTRIPLISKTYFSDERADSSDIVSFYNKDIKDHIFFLRTKSSTSEAFYSQILAHRPDGNNIDPKATRTIEQAVNFIRQALLQDPDRNEITIEWQRNTAKHFQVEPKIIATPKDVPFIYSSADKLINSSTSTVAPSTTSPIASSKKNKLR